MFLSKHRQIILAVIKFANILKLHALNCHFFQMPLVNLIKLLINKENTNLVFLKMTANRVRGDRSIKVNLFVNCKGWLHVDR